MRIYRNNENWLIEDSLSLDLTREIEEFVDKHSKEEHRAKNVDNYSFKGKNSKGYWITKNRENISEDFNILQQRYKIQVLKLLNQSGLLNKHLQRDIDIVNHFCWSTVGEENSYHVAHVHNNGDADGISTILYLKIPETNDTSKHENNIFLILGCNFENHFFGTPERIVDINPTVGKLLIFPNYIVHGTYPQTEGIRKTFNMDFRVIEKEALF